MILFFFLLKMVPFWTGASAGSSSAKLHARSHTICTTATTATTPTNIFMYQNILFFLFWARFISSIVAGKIKDGRKNGKMRERQRKSEKERKKEREREREREKAY